MSVLDRYGHYYFKKEPNYSGSKYFVFFTIAIRIKHRIAGIKIGSKDFEISNKSVVLATT